MNFNKITFAIKKHSPEILTGVGIVGTIVSTVLACKATTKVQTIIDDKNKTLNDIKECVNNPEIDYNEEDEKKDLTITYAKTAKELVKLYAPSILLGSASIVSILGGHKIISNRYATVSAAYVALDTSYKEYRNRVSKRYGNEVEKEIKYNITEKEIEEKDEKGKKKKTVEKVSELNKDNLYLVSPYARFFDECSLYYTKDAEANKMFLISVQEKLNEQLRRKGYLYLNDAYQALGLQESKALAKAGWVYDETYNEGDNYIDFGIFNQTGNELIDEPKRRFVNKLERSALLDFNCLPDIYMIRTGRLS